MSEWNAESVKHDKDQILGHEKTFEIAMRNPEEAAQRWLWSDVDFLKKVWDNNGKNKDTQFADYHGNGHLYGEVAQDVEIECVDCHGTADRYPSLKTSGPAAPPGGKDLSVLRTQDGRARFEWRGGKLFQRSALWPDKEWEVSLVKDSVNPEHPKFNPKAALAKTVSKDNLNWGTGVAPEVRAHKNEEMTCYTCHTSWTTSCGGCHLSMQANWKTRRHHYDFDETRNFATYNPLLQGTNFVNYVGFNAWLGTEDEITAVRVTEWDEPQAVIGSFLHKYAYPDWYRQHQENGRELKETYSHDSGPARCLQLRGEYLFVAEGEDGMRVYDTADIANKGVSQRIVTAPVSPLGQNTHIASKNATCVVLPTNQPPGTQESGQIRHERREDARTDRQDQPGAGIQPIYNYAFITDAEEGLILTDVNTLADGEPRNNFLERALTWNANGILKGARHLTIGGRYFYIAADAGMIVLDMNESLKPKVEAVIPLRDARASALQFRYLFITDAEGLKVIDVTSPAKPRLVKDAVVPLKEANRIYVARTYAYVAAGSEGLVIVDVEKPELPKLNRKFTAGGQINDARDVDVGTTNASLFAYIADGKNGLRVLQLTSPDSQPGFYGFSPEPRPELIATHPTDSPSLSLSKGLDRDRAVDETGGQIAVMGRIGSRPFTSEEMKRLYLNEKGELWTVTDEVE